MIDLSDLAAPALASRLDPGPAFADGVFGALRALTRDSRAGFVPDGTIDGPSVVSGSVLAGQHAEPASDGRVRFYLDRFDVSAPRAPVALAPVSIPGTVLDFDSATGALLTLEAAQLGEPAGAPLCQVTQTPGDRRDDCRVQRRALNALVVEGDRATRVGSLLIDTDERHALRFAVSGGVLYYVTQPAGLTSDVGGPFAARDIVLQRVRLREGRFERLPSFDIAATSDLSPKLWTHFAARGDRALWVVGGQLMVADFRGLEPRLEVHELGPWGCAALALRDDIAYCAQGDAGYVTVPLGEP